MWAVRIFIDFTKATDSPLHSTNSMLPAVSAVQGDCEIV